MMVMGTMTTTTTATTVSAMTIAVIGICGSLLVPLVGGIPITTVVSAVVDFGVAPVVVALVVAAPPVVVILGPELHCISGETSGQQSL